MEIFIFYLISLVVLQVLKIKKNPLPPSLPLGSRNLQHFFKDGLNKNLVYLLLTL